MAKKANIQNTRSFPFALFYFKTFQLRYKNIDTHKKNSYVSTLALRIFFCINLSGEAEPVHPTSFSGLFKRPTKPFESLSLPVSLPA